MEDKFILRRRIIWFLIWKILELRLIIWWIRVIFLCF